MSGVVFLAEGAASSSAIDTAIQGIVTNLESSVTTIIPVAMGVGGIILLATVGWRLIKRFVK